MFKFESWKDLGFTSATLSASAILLGFAPVVPIGFAVTGVGCFAAEFLGKLLEEPDELQSVFFCSNLFNLAGLPELKENKKTNYGYCLRYSLPPGMCLSDFKKKQESIEQFLGHRIDIKYANRNILIQVYENELKTYYEFETVKTKGVLEFPIGYTFKGIQTVNLSEGSPHVLIAGESGSGKSTLLRGILTNLLTTKNPYELKLHLIDLKRVELNIFKNHSMIESFSRTREEAENILYKISGEVDKRYELFEKADCVDIKEYNAKFKKKKLNYQLVIIDEFAELKKEKDSLDIVEQLAAKSRACGIHLLISTQRPSATVINGDIKANVPVVIGLKTMNELNSRIIIDQGGLEELRGKGHGIIRYNGKDMEFQSMSIEPQQARNLIKRLNDPKVGEVEFVKKQPKEIEEQIIEQGQVKSLEFLKLLKGAK